MHYVTFLEKLHAQIDPEFYFEIGVRNGRSLGIAQKKAVGIDPVFKITFDLPDDVEMLETTSDEFFKNDAKALFDRLGAPQLSLIDGMHLSEFALRDFINTEKYCTRDSVIVFDDMLPKNWEMANREHLVQVWTGDVWKVQYALKKYRPDLEIHLVDTNITGVMTVTNLDPTNTVLEDNYETIEKEMMYIYQDVYKEQFENEILTRSIALDPREVLKRLRENKRDRIRADKAKA